MLHGWRIWALALGFLVAVLAALAVVALVAWPRARLDPSSEALAQIVLPRFAGRVDVVRVDSAKDGRVPVRLRQGGLFPERPLAAGERLTVELKVRRPGWASWLVGRTVDPHVHRRDAGRPAERAVAAGASQARRWRSASTSP